MARGQTEFDFRGCDADARAAFVERNNELRSRLRSIAVNLTGLSPRRWEQVCEVLMAVWVHATTTKPQRATTCRVCATSGLSERQFREARGLASRLGLLRSVRSYAGTSRSPDRLEVDLGGVDLLCAQSRDLARPKRRLQPGCNPAPSRLQVGSSDTVNPRARAGAALELPITLTTTTTSAAEEKQVAVVELEKLVKECRKHFGRRCPDQLVSALETAIENGCTIDQLRQRCKWFYENRSRWPSQHQPGTLHCGLKIAEPDMPHDVGWPYR